MNQEAIQTVLSPYEPSGAQCDPLMYMYMYVYMYVYMHIHIYTYIHTYTHT